MHAVPAFYRRTESGSGAPSRPIPATLIQIRHCTTEHLFKAAEIDNTGIPEPAAGREGML
jgi:hypothetical protein